MILFHKNYLLIFYLIIEDRDLVIQRAVENNVQKMLVTASTLQESEKVLTLCKKHPGLLYGTAGVHPCQSLELSKPLSDEFNNNSQEENESNYLTALKNVIIEGHKLGYIKAFGEIGLDYDRLHFSPADVQRRVFKLQLDLALELSDLDLPLFLHSRAAAEDFENMLNEYIKSLESKKNVPLSDSTGRKRIGVVHSFTGTVEEMKRLVDQDLFIGINGCSLKTEQNLQVVKEVPLSHLLLETDGPWCEIRPSHASFTHLKKAAEQQAETASKTIKRPNDLLSYKTVKKEKYVEGALVNGRCEPCAIGLVAQVVANVKEIPLKTVCQTVWDNTIYLFQLE